MADPTKSEGPSSPRHEAPDLVHASPYAKGVALFTSDGGAARRFQSEVQVGMVGSIPWAPDRGVGRGGDPRRRANGGRQSGSLP